MKPFRHMAPLCGTWVSPVSVLSRSPLALRFVVSPSTLASGWTTLPLRTLSSSSTPVVISTAVNSTPAPEKKEKADDTDSSKSGLSGIWKRRWEEALPRMPKEYPELPAEDLEFIRQQVQAKEKVVFRVDRNAIVNKLRSSLFTPSPWSPTSRRAGVLARKMGMLQLYDEWGARFPVTVLMVDDCQVLQVKEEPNKAGLVNVQVGAGIRRPRSTPKPQLGHFAKAGVTPKRILVEFNVTPDAVLPVGTRLHARHFLPGQFVDVTGYNKGKGFAGVMKRWGFKGQPATHGVSVSHRSHGSTGQRQDPGKVFKGKKMAGRLGNERNTIQNLIICRIDPGRNLIYVKGSVPGHPGTWLQVKDAIKKKFDPAHPPPFPTFFPQDGEQEPAELLAPKAKSDPFLVSE